MKFLWSTAKYFLFSICLVAGALLWQLCAPPTIAQLGGRPAPDLSSGGNWLNLSRPLKLSDLKGKVVLLDFWTDSCVNCIHALPRLKELEAKYGKALVVIGVHSPKYPNEKSDCLVKTAILKFGLNNPVLNDPDSILWRRYGVRYWPTFVLINQKGTIVGQISGDQHLDRLDQAVATVVSQARAAGSLDDKSERYKLSIEQPDSKWLSFPEKIVASEKSERLYIADSGHNRLLVVTADGRLIKVIGDSKAGRADGYYADAQFNAPHGLALGDKLYVADTGNNLIRCVDLTNETVSTIAGRSDKSPPSMKAGPALSVKLDTPQDVCLLGGDLYVAVAGQNQLWRLNLATRMAEPVAGTTTEGLKDGLARTSLLAQPAGVTTDGTSLYFTDSESSSIRELDPGTNMIHTLIGRGLFDFGDKDGSPSAAKLQHPLGLFYWKNRIFVADTLNNKIKSFNLKQWSLTTLAGTHQPGCEDGKRAQFSNPNGLAMLNGKLYIADTNNDSVRVLDPVSGVVSTLTIAPTGSGSEH